jgi:hypothetical protein
MEKALKEQIIEALAAVEHDQWSSWAQSVKGEVSEERRARWEGLFVPYDQLDESNKDLDREWAVEAFDAIEPLLGEANKGGMAKEMITKVEVDSKKYPGLASVLGGKVCK